MSQEEIVAEIPPAPWSSPGSGLPPAGYRQTGPRARVWSLIAGLERPFSAEEVVRQARAQAWPVSRATVYRALSLFERLGLIERVHGLGRTHRYVRCAPRHHHHLICAGCGRVEDLPGCPLEELLPAGAVSPRSDLADLWRTWPDGRVKLLLTALGLRFRRAQAALFADGAYLPLLVEGPARRHACAFARTLGGRWAVTVMPRLACTLMGGPQEIGGWEPALPVGQAVWAETRVRLPAGAPRRWRNVLTGEEVQAEVVGPHGDGAVALGHLFRTFPLALLAGDVTLDRRHFGVLRSARGRPFRLLPE